MKKSPQSAQQREQGKTAACCPNFQREIVRLLDLLLGGLRHQARVVFTKIAGTNAQPRPFLDHAPGGLPVFQSLFDRFGGLAHASREQPAARSPINQADQQERSYQRGDGVTAQLASIHEQTRAQPRPPSAPGLPHGCASTITPSVRGWRSRP